MSIQSRPLLPASLLFLIAASASPAEDHAIPRTVVTAALPGGADLVDGDALSLFQAASVDDLSGVVPGLHVVSADAAGYGSIYTMRGSGNVLFFGPPAVGFSIDGAPQANAFAFPTELIELEAVRVHRGPRGAYTGRNAAAGQINLLTPGPSESQVFRLRTDYGSHDSIGAGLFSSGPVAGDFAHTLQLYYRERDGFITNNFVGGKLDDRERYGGRLKVFWTPREDLEAWVAFSAEGIDDGDQRLSSLLNPFSSPDPFTVGSDRPGETQIERYSLSSHFSKKFDWGTISSVGGISWWDLDPSRADLDLGNPFVLPPGTDAFSVIRQSQDAFTREIRYDSPENAPVRWQAGVFFMDVENSGEAFRQLATAPVLWDETTTFQIDERNYALFANAEVDLGNAVSLEGGLRIDYHEAKIDRLKTSSIAAPAAVTGSLDDIYLSPTATLRYEASEAVGFYLRSGLGIKPAGFTAYSDDPAVAEYDEETNWSTEVGLEYTPCEEVQAGVRAYFNRIDDYQVNQSLADPAVTDFVISNAEEVTVWGVEADLIWRPTERLTIRGSVGWQNAEFDDYMFFDPSVATTFDYSGNAVPFVPEFTSSLGVHYDFGNGFYAQTSLRGIGKTHFDSAETPLFAENSYAVWDAEVGFRANGYSISVYGRNLLDEEYYSFIDSNIFAGAPGDPQVVGVRATAEF